LDVLLAFAIASVLSFFGSVFLGLVNVAVIDTAITKSPKSALWLAFGGVLPEIPYTLIAIVGTSYVEVLSEYRQSIAIVVGFIFIVMGISYLFKKQNNKEIKRSRVNETGALNHFVKGFLLAIANPQLIFFWSSWLIAIQSLSGGQGLIDFTSNIFFVSPKISFAIGAAAGAFAILFIYVKLSSIYKDQLLKLIGDKLSSIVGGIFIVMGLFVIIKNVI
jgi:threonine/homoserine/homoserine lactone efflux protein